MAHRSPPSLFQQIMEGAKPALPRSVATLLMLAGAVGFVVSLVAFEGQLLCLFASTVIVFVGLFFSLIARRSHLQAEVGTVRDRGWQPAEAERGAQFNEGIPRQAPAPRSWSQPERRPVVPGQGSGRMQTSITRQPFQRSAGSGTSPHPFRTILAGQVSDVLRGQGAIVWIETQREDRSILKVRTRSGDTFTAVVLEGSKVVDVNEVRGLYGLMAASGSIGAFMVTGGSYTAKAQDWARQRSLTLLEAGQVSEIRVE